MESKDFERTFRFEEDPDNGISYPIIRASFLTQFNNWIEIPLLFDTGADHIVLSEDYLNSFTSAGYKRVGTAGRKTMRRVPIATTRARLLGIEGDCTVAINKLPDAIYSGLFGRDPFFTALGFGFWEQVGELYVTLKP